jgi:hypothetical protein
MTDVMDVIAVIAVIDVRLSRVNPLVAVDKRLKKFDITVFQKKRP